MEYVNGDSVQFVQISLQEILFIKSDGMCDFDVKEMIIYYLCSSQV